jgi:hypothetical protein
LLIQQAQSGPALFIANHFVTSQLKQRIVMLTKKASSPSIAGWKYGLIVPIFTLLALVYQQNFAFAQRKADPNRVAQIRQLEKNGWITVDTVITFDPTTKVESVKTVTLDERPFINKKDEIVYPLADIMPTYNGGESAMNAFVKANFKKTQGFPNNQTFGIYVTIQVNKNGKVSVISSDIYHKTAFKQELKAEAERVVASMPDWLPAEHRGEFVVSQVDLTVVF